MKYLYGGQAGGGKSEGLLLFALLRRLQYPGSVGLMLRRTFRELDKSLIRKSKFAQAWSKQANWASAMMNGGQEPHRLGNAHPNIVPYDVYKAQDKYFIVTVGTEKIWSNFCDSLGFTQLKNDPRFATNADRVQHRVEMTEILSDFFATKPAHFWLEKLAAANVPSGPLSTVADTMAHQHQARNFIVSLEHPTDMTVKSMGNPIRLSDTPASYRLAPPMLGQHTSEILLELGYDATMTVSLQTEGVI